MPGAFQLSETLNNAFVAPQCRLQKLWHEGPPGGTGHCHSYPPAPLITRPQPIIAKWERGEESSYFKYKSSDQSESMDIDSSALFIPKDKSSKFVKISSAEILVTSE